MKGRGPLLFDWVRTRLRKTDGPRWNGKVDWGTGQERKKLGTAAEGGGERTRTPNT